MPLVEQHKRQLRALGHKLKPVVIVGNAGLSENVLTEIRLTLDHHELIKIRVNAADRIERQRIIDEIRTHTRAELVQKIGHIVMIYLKNREKKHPIVLG